MVTIRRVLASLRVSFERLYVPQLERDNVIDGNRIKRILLELEAIRLLMAPIWAGPPDPRYSRESYLRTLAGLRDFSTNPDFIEYGRSLRVRLNPAPQPDLFAADASLFDKRNAVEVVANLIEVIEAQLGLSRSENVELELRELRRVVPEQKIAPVQFFFRDNRIAVLKSKSRPEEEDSDNVVAAKGQLQAAGEKILEELARSNCDKRLIESVKFLQGQLSEDNNIVQLGLSNITCEAMCHAFQTELPDAVTAMLTAHTRGVELYIGQFPEWHRFVENAASTELDQSDVSVLNRTASNLIEKLEQNPDLAEPEVPLTIKRINELLKSPGKGGKRIAFAMLRTLENLISNVFAHSIDFLEMTVKKTKEQVSGIVARAAAVVLLTIALDSATSMSSVANKVAEVQWLKSAITIVQKQLQQLTRE
jgi:hypothetical protein